jgi:hypothetical protein
MTRMLFLIAAAMATCAVSMPASAADFEGDGSGLVDQRACLDMAREEGRYIIEFSLLHPLVKGEEYGEAYAHAFALKQEKQSVHHERRRVKCI